MPLDFGSLWQFQRSFLNRTRDCWVTLPASLHYLNRENWSLRLSLILTTLAGCRTSTCLFWTSSIFSAVPSDAFGTSLSTLSF